MMKKRVKFCGLLSMPEARMCAAKTWAALLLAMAASSCRPFFTTIFTAPAVS